MNRRGFLQLSLVGGMATLAGLDSVEDNGESFALDFNDKPTYSYPPKDKLDDLYLSQEAMEDIQNWGVEEVDEETKKEILTPPKKIVEVDEYKPRWNINGSWAKAEDRGELIKHLSGSVHRKDPNHLITLSVDDLQRLHDNSHWSMGSRTFKKPRKRKRRR